jgi:UDP-N-acetylmuramoyl-tripeptide--D-alanyl-D-alanine ligase
MKRLFSRFLPSYPRALVYMLQSTEYRVGPYLLWYGRTVDFRAVAHRRSLEQTRAARLLLTFFYVGMFLQLAVGATAVYLGVLSKQNLSLFAGLIVALSYPWVGAYLLTVPIIFGRAFIIYPRERRLMARSRRIFSEYPGVVIAVAGSYGKTSMKELLLTVLSEGKKVAATPANKNVASSHAAFAAHLDGDEDILIVEYGEGAPGDVKRFAETTDPDIGIITGIAPAHLDQYGTLEAAARDIFSLADYLKDDHIYINAESPAARDYIKPTHLTYDSSRAADWKISGIRVTAEGTSFTMRRGKQHFSIRSRLLGRHQVGPLALAAALADELGLSKAQIMAGLAKTEAFEHRMQARQLPGDIWIIDDTYNGNIEGMRAGLRLLAELPAKRRIYVTPGLVDQGPEHLPIHQELGKLIAATKPDMVVLMQNSATAPIRQGLDEAGYSGKLLIEDDPLAFYNQIDQFVAAGDVVLLQNDWTDNYI